MSARRIVTANNAAGKSAFISDDAIRPSEFKHVPGMSKAAIWRTPPSPCIAAHGANPSVAATSLLPELGATQLLLVTFPPDDVMTKAEFDPVAAGAEYHELLPGLAEKFERDNPGMHTTDTVDYGVVLEGEIHLELDDGVMRKLMTGDIIIQNGTRHAWRNRSEKAAKILFVLIGAKRKI